MASLPSDVGAFDDAGYVLPSCAPRSTVDVDVATDRAPGRALPDGRPERDQRACEKRRHGGRSRGASLNWWRRTGEQWLIWCETDYEADALTRRCPAQEVRGSDSLEKKERILTGFADGGFGSLISKPKLAALA
jgi:hypothetical protein